METPEREAGYREAAWQRHIGKGPGDYLHDHIKAKIGEEPILGCNCKARIRLMNQWGLARCRERVDEIAGWLEEEAKQRGWLNAIMVSVPFVSDFFVRRFINQALDLCAATYPTFQAFYHIACMGNWQAVVTEQMGLFTSVGITPTACVIGSAADVEWIQAKGIVVHSRYDSFAQFETPTLQVLYDWCRANPDGFAMYIHTKGVSRPESDNKRAWRQLMQLYTVGDWMKNIDALRSGFDAVGVNFRDAGHDMFPHFQGNFWMATAAWINKLMPPTKHRVSREWPAFCGPRLHAEMWVGSRPEIRVKSLCCENSTLWYGRRVYALLAAKLRESAGTPGMASPPSPMARALANPAFVKALLRPKSAMRRRMVK
jgi:hypothetical protein